jgi:uncharacterized protein (DUF488 family)
MSDLVSVSTIGFTKTTAQNFFDRLKSADVRTVIDVRLNNTSQLAGFAKSDDLAYFLKQIGGIRYTHQPSLAPSDGMLKAYKKERGEWSDYERQFLALMEARKIEHKYKQSDFDQACLLCSEDKPHQCHRRLVCDYLNHKWGGTLRVRHL